MSDLSGIGEQLADCAFDVFYGVVHGGVLVELIDE